MKQLTVYLSGEVHSGWRDEIITRVAQQGLPVDFLTPVTDHPASDSVGESILGPEDNPFWKDHKAAGINSIRIRKNIEKSDLVVVKFGEKYKQWNAAFEAGYAVAKGKMLITIHAPEHIHALKEIDATAQAVAENTDQVIRILEYLTTQK